jgi:hypothetical protein
MKATSSRRQLIVFVLLGLALAGAALRQWSANPSLARDIGTLLLVLWLPVIGNVVAFVITRLQRARRADAAAAFAPDEAFAAHLLVQVTAAGPGASARSAPSPHQRNCTLVVGHEGFTARAATPLAQWLGCAQPRTVALQLLRPALALRRLPAGTGVRVMVEGSVVGSGRVLESPAREPA